MHTSKAYVYSFYFIFITLPLLIEKEKNMLVKVYGSAVFGIDATTITVEVNIDKGIGYHLVGLPDNAVRESSCQLQKEMIIYTSCC